MCLGRFKGAEHFRKGRRKWKCHEIRSGSAVDFRIRRRKKPSQLQLIFSPRKDLEEEETIERRFRGHGNKWKPVWKPKKQPRSSQNFKEEKIWPEKTMDIAQRRIKRWRRVKVKMESVLILPELILKQIISSISTTGKLHPFLLKKPLTYWFLPNFSSTKNLNKWNSSFPSLQKTMKLFFLFSSSPFVPDFPHWV